MKHVLIARLSSLGDIVLTQPICQAVHDHGDHVSLLVQPAYQQLGQLLAGVDLVVTPQDLPSQTYELLIDLHGTQRSAKVLRQIQANKKVRYPKYNLGRRLLVKPFGRPMFWNNWSSLRSVQSVVTWYSQAANQAGYQVHQRTPRLNFNHLNRSELLNQLYELGVSHKQPLAILAPGAKWGTKQWPIHHFSELALQLLQQDYQVIMIGHQSDYPLGKEIKDASSLALLSLIGQTTIEQLAVLLSISHIVISNDSGPMHLGLAAGAKVVALFGPTIGEFGFMPNQPNCQVLSVALPCKPCSIHGSKRCPLGHHDCMEKISVEQVRHAVTTLTGKGM